MDMMIRKSGSRSGLETWNWKWEIWETCLRAGTHRQGWNNFYYPEVV